MAYMNELSWKEERWDTVTEGDEAFTGSYKQQQLSHTDKCSGH